MSLKISEWNKGDFEDYKYAVCRGRNCDWCEICEWRTRESDVDW